MENLVVSGEAGMENLAVSEDLDANGETYVENLPVSGEAQNFAGETRADITKPDLFQEALRKCTWRKVKQLVSRGVNAQQRDDAASQAVRHSQWWLLDLLLQAGISQLQRDQAVHKAIRYGQWDCVLQLLNAGISPDKRNFVLQRTLRHERWKVVSCLLNLGVDLQGRNDTVAQAVLKGRWKVVFKAAEYGVGQNVQIQSFEQIIAQKRWKFAPKLLKLFPSPEHTNMLLQSAIKNCQWDCVKQLIQIGLTSVQQQLVCSEALEWAHYECAFELLRQGVGPESTGQIVTEFLNSQRYQDLISLLQEQNLRPHVRDIVLQRVKDHELWDTYLAMLQILPQNEKELTDIIATALRSIHINIIQILRLLISPLSWSSGKMCSTVRRVFKQVLRRTRFPENNIFEMHTLLMTEELSLAFHMLVAQDMWHHVANMYSNDGLTARERRKALRLAVKKAQWRAVEKMVLSQWTLPSDRRYALLQMVREGKWRLTLRLTSMGVKLRGPDKVFALRIWLSMGLWRCLDLVLQKWCYLPFFQGWKYSEISSKLIRCALKETIAQGKLKTFMEICRKEDLFKTVDKECIIESVVQTAVAHARIRFITELCKLTKNQDGLESAFEFVINSKKWKLMKNLVRKSNK